MHFVFEFSIDCNHLLEQSSGSTRVHVVELACKNTLVFCYLLCWITRISQASVFIVFHGNSQQVVGKAASILPVMIVLKLPKKRRIGKQEKKGQLINPNLSQSG